MVINMLKSTFFQPEEARIIAKVVKGSAKPVVDVPAGGKDFFRVQRELAGTGLPAYDLPEKAARVLRFLYDQHLALEKKNAG